MNGSLLKIIDILNNFECIDTLSFNKTIFKIKFHSRHKLLTLTESEFRFYDLNLGKFMKSVIQLKESDYIIGDIYNVNGLLQFKRLCAFFDFLTIKK